MSDFDHKKDYSTIVGPGARGKYVQNGTYFDRDFKQIVNIKGFVTERTPAAPAALPPGASFKAEPVPTTEVAPTQFVGRTEEPEIVAEKPRGRGRPRKSVDA